MDIMKGTLSPVASMSVVLSATATMTGKLTVPDVIALPDYTGEYEITPGEEAQVLSTSDRTLRENITINPIPSNYGLITWDGTKITVS